MRNRILKYMGLGGLLGGFFHHLLLMYYCANDIASTNGLVVTPLMYSSMNQLHAAYLEFALFFYMGAMLGLAFAVFKLECRSMIIQVTIQYALFIMTVLPFGYATDYLTWSWEGVLNLLGIILLVYGMILLAEFVSLKINIREMNENLAGKEHNRKLQCVPYIVLLLELYYVFPIVLLIRTMDWYDAMFATNILNYCLYPFVITAIGAFAGVKLRFNVIVPLASGLLILPVSLLLYQDPPYSLILVCVMLICSTIGTLIGWPIGRLMKNANQE